MVDGVFHNTLRKVTALDVERSVKDGQQRGSKSVYYMLYQEWENTGTS